MRISFLKYSGMLLRLGHVFKKMFRIKEFTVEVNLFGLFYVASQKFEVRVVKGWKLDKK